MLGDPCRSQAQGDRCDRCSVRPLHPAERSRIVAKAVQKWIAGHDRLHRAGQLLGEFSIASLIVKQLSPATGRPSGLYPFSPMLSSEKNRLGGCTGKGTFPCQWRRKARCHGWDEDVAAKWCREEEDAHRERSAL